MARSARKKPKTRNTKTKLQVALNKLSAEVGTSIKVGSTAQETAAAYVYALGCTICTDKIDYSLLDAQTDEEVIENENIDASKEFKRIKASTTLATDKFSNTSDPFYELDDDISERVKVARTTITETSSIDLSSLALSLSRM